MTFILPQTLEDVFQAVEAGAVPVAGGTDLYVRLRKSGDTPRMVGLEGLPRLSGIELEENRLTIGAAVTWQQILDSRKVSDHAPLLAQAALQVGGPAIRHMGTLGGNVCTASPAGDGLAALWAMDAQVGICSRKGNRMLPLDEFIMGPGTNTLLPGELLERIIIPVREGLKPFFYKVGKRKALAISVGSLAALWRKEEGVIRDVKLVFGSMGPVPMRGLEAEKLFEGVLPDHKLIEKAATICSETVTPIDDVRASAGYRRKLAAGLVKMLALQMQQ